jgi:hypothetical protein
LTEKQRKCGICCDGILLSLKKEANLVTS